MKGKLLKKLILASVIVVMTTFSLAVAVLVWKQDDIVQRVITDFNEDFKGAIVIEDSDISPFSNFPYISIVIKNVQVFEDQADMFAPILDVSNIYLGFNFWSLLSGKTKVNLLKVENGNFDIIRHEDGTFNLITALSGEKEIDEIKKEYSIELDKIELLNLDIIKYDEGTKIHAETYIESATSKFINSPNTLSIALSSQLVLNVIHDGDSTIFKNKHFDANTELDYDKSSGILKIHPSDIKLKNGLFKVDGTINVHEDFDIDLNVEGNNPNFNLLIAFAPEELIPTLEQYENAGEIYFNATLKGKSLRGQYPAINAEFGCESAHFTNPDSKTKLEEITFKGHFTNGEMRNASTMEFVLENVSAKPEAGNFLADLAVRNFESPEIEMSISSDFDLDFLAKFLNVTSLENLDGDVSLKMNFRDIVDLQNPEKSLEELSQSYYTELDVKNLTFKIPDYPLSFDSIDVKATMDGNRASIEYIYVNMGHSDLTIKGEIDDLPAIVHQSGDSVNAELFFFSSMLDINELTSTDTINKKPFNEKINNMRLELGFKTIAKSLSTYKYLPAGDFHIKNFYGKLDNYPHTLRKFQARVIIGEDDLDIIDLTGKVDRSDFHYQGILYDYATLMKDQLLGSIEVDFSINSNLVRLNDLFTYQGVNYVPKDYRKEELSNVQMYGNAEFEFNESLESTKIFFDQLYAKLHVHDLEIKDIHGKFEIDQDYLKLSNMSGEIGNTTFETDMNLYLGDSDSLRKATNFANIYAPLIDFDQLSNYELNYPDDSATVNHDSVFNIYTLPFTDLNFQLDIDQLKYHKHLITDINADVRIQKNHFLYVDTLSFLSSGGHVDISGYFDGSNPDSISFFPKIRVDTINLNQIFYRFDNFGQDYLVSNNLSGFLSGSIFGRLQVHADMVPQIENSEFYMQLEIVNGELKNYKPLEAISDYFKDKNLNAIRFDTLSNKLMVSRGIINIPQMTINSTLGYMDISGSQDMNNNMEYYFRVPLKMVTKAAKNKLFGKKGVPRDSTQLDEIQYKSDKKKTWYINLKLEGNDEDYKVSMAKKKSRQK